VNILLRKEDIFSTGVYVTHLKDILAGLIKTPLLLISMCITLSGNNRGGKGKVHTHIKRAQEMARTKAIPKKYVRKIIDKKHPVLPKRLRCVDFIIDKLPFALLVRDISQKYKTDQRFKPEVIQTLQEAADAYLMELFKRANTCATEDDRMLFSISRQPSLKK
jgi:histone H3/H4